MVWLKPMFFECKVKVKPFNMTEDDDERKVEKKYKIKVMEDNEDDLAPDLIESVADDEVEEADE